MGLKQIIKQQKILASGAVDAELVLPGEPMIYSIKYSIGSRTRSVQFFRNEKWKSLLKCFFRSYYNTKVPVVVVVRFYVSPPAHLSVKSSDLRKETVPAVFSYEVCDYLLSFIEMIHHVLINSYRQIVKIEVEKFYSSNPRTVFKFMKWDHYVMLQNKDTVHAQSQSIGENRTIRPLQSELQGNAKNQGVCSKVFKRTHYLKDSFEWSPPCHSSLSNTVSSKPLWKKTPTAKFPTSYKKTRRGQPGEVSE